MIGADEKNYYPAQKNTGRPVINQVTDGVATMPGLQKRLESQMVYTAQVGERLRILTSVFCGTKTADGCMLPYPEPNVVETPIDVLYNMTLDGERIMKGSVNCLAALEAVLLPQVKSDSHE